MADQTVLLAVGVSVGVILVLFLGILSYCLCTRRRRRDRSHYEELTSTYTVAPTFPECTAPVIPVSPVPCNRPTEVPFTLPPSFKPRTHGSPKDGPKEEEEGTEDEGYRDILAHRGSLSVRSWYPVGAVLSGLYCVNETAAVAPPPGGGVAAPPRLCLAVEYRHAPGQLLVSLLRLANLPPRFHGNATAAELRLLPDDEERRPRQVRARGAGPDPEFNHCCLFQLSGVSVCHSTLSVCVQSVDRGGQRHTVGRVSFSLEGALCPAGRVLWRDLETHTQPECSELGDVQISLSYSPALQRLTVVILRARGLQLLTEAGVCVRVCLQIHTQVVKSKQSSAVMGGGATTTDPSFDLKVTFKLRPQQLDDACLRVELQQPDPVHTEPPGMLGVVVLGPFMYSRGEQLQHWMDTVNTPQQLFTHWHRLRRST